MRKQCSNIFDEVFDSRGGGCVRVCSCGRTHFDNSPTNHWEEGELEALEKNSIEKPDQYIAHDGTVGCMEIDSKQIVYDCTCDLASSYERFIVNHAEKIAEYLRRRAKALRENADKIDIPVEEPAA